MTKKLTPDAGGWLVGKSIAMELDVVLNGLLGITWSAAFQNEFPELIEQLPKGWLAEGYDVLGRPQGSVSFLEMLAFLAGNLFEDDYKKTTLTLRSLTTAQVLLQLEEFSRPYQLVADSGKSESDQIIELGTALFSEVYTSIGLKFTDLNTFVVNIRRNLTQLNRIIKNGDRHDWFWMWMDRFYYEVYKPWRETRVELLNHNEAHAVMALGGMEKTEGEPQTAWLPAQNPLLTQPAYLEAIRTGKLSLFFWVEPFGLADIWSLYPGMLAVSFSEPGGMYIRFFQNAQELAVRAQAIADPTRLVILRLIRHFGMINTEIGKFLGISRPTVSIHAKLLREAGLIRSREQGREMRHEIVPGELQRLFHDLEQFLDLEDKEKSE